MGRRNKVSSETVTMLDHVRELRWRLLIVVVVLLIGGVAGYLLYEPILQWLKSPLVGELYYNTPAGSFNFIMKVASMAGIGLAVPVIVYQLIMFIRPAFTQTFSRRRIYGYTFLSVVLALSGAAFGFYLILPGALHFFAGFQVEGLSALIGADSYLSFVTNVLITFMLVFQIPLLLVIIDHVKPIQPMKLLKAEKYVVLGGLVVSFFVPFALDITTSLLIATPIILLYNLSIVMIVWRHALQKRHSVELAEIEREELAIDERSIAEFFGYKEIEPVSSEVQTVVAGQTQSFRGFAMEFQKSKQASIDELRSTIENERALAIAAKVARYNTPVRLQNVIDVQ